MSTVHVLDGLNVNNAVIVIDGDNVVSGLAGWLVGQLLSLRPAATAATSLEIRAEPAGAALIAA